MSRSDWCADNGDGTRNLNWYCPGCDRYHGVPIDGPRAWGFNEDWDRPTLTPSVLVNKDADGSLVGEGEHAVVRHRCHLFLRNGRIQFLGDCTHHLAGQTIDLPKSWGDSDE